MNGSTGKEPGYVQMLAAIVMYAVHDGGPLAWAVAFITLLIIAVVVFRG